MSVPVGTPDAPMSGIRLHSALREEIPCPLCKENGYTVKHHINGWRLVQCTACKLVYVNPRLQKDQLLQIYSSNYFDNREVGYYHYTENSELRRRNFRKWIADALPYAGSHLRTALDVGCAAGYCLEEFIARGWEAYGIELDRELAAGLRTKNFRVFDQPLLQMQTAQAFDLITLFDVLEHLTDLNENMSRLHSLLNPGGLLVIVTPDYGSWQRRLFGRRWFQFKPVEHINYFCFTTFRQLAENNSFDILTRKASGQFCDAAFLENRLRKYGLGFSIPSFRFLLRVLRLNGKLFYVDTASLYLVLKKKSS